MIGLAVLCLHKMSSKRKRRLSLSKRVASTAKLQEKKEPQIMSKCCRTCLAMEGLEPIFSSKEIEEKRSHELKTVTGLEIKMNDNLSQNICKQCTDSINSSLHFRRVSKKAEKALLGMVAGAPPKKKKKYRDKTNISPSLPSDDQSAIKSEVNVEVMPVKVEYSYDDYGGEDFQNYDYGGVHSAPVIQKPPAPRQKRAPRARNPSGSAYKCGTCHKEFRMMATYKAHMRFHTHFCVCETCGKRCRNNVQLQEHKRALHGLGRIHKCAYCVYSSATKEALVIHERRHTGERPYICDHCGASFHRRSNLVQHIAIHLSENNWQCDLCPKRLKSKKFLQIHKHNVHTGKRYGYLCAVCAHRFEKPNKVRAHTRRVHGIPDELQAAITRVQL